MNEFSDDEDALDFLEQKLLRTPITWKSKTESFFQMIGMQKPESPMKKLVYMTILITFGIGICVWVFVPSALVLPESVTKSDELPPGLSFSLDTGTEIKNTEMSTGLETQPQTEILGVTNFDSREVSNLMQSTSTTQVIENDMNRELVVHVAGAVNHPGVYTFKIGDRVHDGIERAGGFDLQADLDRINLAAPLVDATRLYVLHLGEAEVPSVSESTSEVTQNFAGSNKLEGINSKRDTPIHLNSASQEEFETLPGIGPALATAIVEDRNRNGPFTAISDLDRVSGIGSAKLEKILPLVQL